MIMDFFYSKDDKRSATIRRTGRYESWFKYEVSLSSRTKTRGTVKTRMARTKDAAVKLAKDWVS